MTTKYYCLECKKLCKNVYVCGNCKKAAYCGSNCQRNNWNKEHSTKCIDASAILNLFKKPETITDDLRVSLNKLWDILIYDIIDVDNPATLIKDLTNIMVDQDPKILLSKDEIEMLREKRTFFLKWLFDFDAEDKPISYQKLFSDYFVRLSFARNLVKTICGTQRMEGYESPASFLMDFFPVLYYPYMETVTVINSQTHDKYEEYTEPIYRKEMLNTFSLCFLNACQAGNVDIIGMIYKLADDLFPVYVPLNFGQFKWNYPEKDGFEVALQNKQIEVLFYLYSNKREQLERKIKKENITKTSGDDAFVLCIDQYSQDAEFLFFLAQYANVSAEVLKSALQLFTKTNNESAALKIFYWLESIKRKERFLKGKSYRSVLELQTILNVTLNGNYNMMEIFLKIYNKSSYELTEEEKRHFFCAFVYAAETNQQEIVELIPKYIHIGDNNYLQEAIWKAIHNNHTIISSELLKNNKHYINIDLDLFMVALKNQNTEIVKSILFYNVYFKEEILKSRQMKLYYTDKYMPELSDWVRHRFLAD